MAQFILYLNPAIQTNKHEVQQACAVLAGLWSLEPLYLG